MFVCLHSRFKHIRAQSPCFQTLACALDRLYIIVLPRFRLKCCQQGSPPSWIVRDLLSVGIDCLPIVVTSARVQVDLIKLQETFSLPEVPTSPEEENDRQGQVCLEEALSVVEIGREWWCNGDEELSGERDEDQEQPEPGPSGAEKSLEWNLIERSALSSPRLSEPDVGKADRAPGEERSKTGKREQPVEHKTTGRSQCDVCEATECQVEDD